MTSSVFLKVTMDRSTSGLYDHAEVNYTNRGSYLEDVSQLSGFRESGVPAPYVVVWEDMLEQPNSPTSTTSLKTHTLYTHHIASCPKIRLAASSKKY